MILVILLQEKDLSNIFHYAESGLDSRLQSAY